MGEKVGGGTEAEYLHATLSLCLNSHIFFLKTFTHPVLLTKHK